MIFLRRFKRYNLDKKIIRYNRDRQNNRAYLIQINHLVIMDVVQMINMLIIRYHSFKMRLQSNGEYRAIYYYPYGRKNYSHIKLEIINDALIKYDFKTSMLEWYR